MIKVIYDNIAIIIEEEKDIIEYGNGLIAKKAVGQKTQDTGIVASVGDGRLTTSGALVPLKVKTGDRVVFNKFAGAEITFEGRRYLIVKESDVLAIF